MSGMGDMGGSGAMGGGTGHRSDAGGAWASLPLPALILDPAGRVRAINDAAEAWLNLSRRMVEGQALDAPDIARRLRAEPPLPQLAQAAEASGQPQPVRFRLADRIGGHRSRAALVHAGRHPDGLALVIVPRPDAAPDAAGKAALAAVGLAQMLAHEIKNPLAGIRGAAQLIEMQAAPSTDPEGGIPALTALIVAECQRVVDLLAQVERFGDTTPPRRAPVNIHDVLERARRMASLGAARGVAITTDYDPSLPPALADADQLVQVALNLIVNAAQAITASGTGGRIRLRSHYDGTIRGPAGPLPLQVEIADDGPGLPPHLAERIFEPFVSGRENGTGLGLALVAKIVADHGAAITTRRQGGLTRFRLSLPLAPRGA